MAKNLSKSSKATTKRTKHERAKKELPDCCACGACCVSPYDQDVFCDISEADEKLLGAALVRRYVLYPSFFDSLCSAIDEHAPHWGAIKTRWRTMRAGPLKGTDVCACVFLEGTVLKRVKCRIYEKRPQTCRRAMRPGEKACLKLRRLFQETVESITRDD